MSFSLNSFKNPKVIKISLVVLVVLAVAVFSLIKLGVISANSTPASYKYTGKVTTGASWTPSNLAAVGGTVSLERYHTANDCTGSSATVSKVATIDPKGNFSIDSLKTGCYEAYVDGFFKKNTGGLDRVGKWLKFAVPAVSKTTVRNFLSPLKEIRIVGSFRTTPTPTPTPTPAPTYYSVSGAIKDKNGNPISGVNVVSGTTYSPKIMVGNPTKCDVGQRSIASRQTLADTSGNFALTGLPEGCYTLRISRPGTATISWIKNILGSRAYAAVGVAMPAATMPTTVTIVVPPGLASTTTTVTNADGSVSVTVTVKPGATTPKTPTPTPKTPTPTSTPAEQGTISGVVRKYNQDNVFIGYAAADVKWLINGGFPPGGTVAETTSSASDGVYTLAYQAGPGTLWVDPHDIDGCLLDDFPSRIADGYTTTLDVNLRCGNRAMAPISFEVMVGNDGTRPNITDNARVALVDDTTGKEINSITAQELTNNGNDWRYAFFVPLVRIPITYTIKATGFSQTRPGNGQPVLHSCQPLALSLTPPSDTTHALHLSCP